ncbi:hypothetical protein BN1708_010678 [Verticillium longisporum]|uniref:Inner centromere protein ARK-binding domain-containing protein n=1 Tax=Verticillium longisporum TaxID=100787 RepID=A0A0G4KT16_VERLO|nr:hypothetical protein BN1708_010678 [Verticillium longisporum]
MAAMRGARVPVGSATWMAGERSSAEDIVKTETEEFSYSVRNEFDWLNEHMADVFNENAINVAEMFKTPGKLRGKTPRTARKVITGEPRVPLSDIFSSASKGAPTPFTQQLGRLQSPRLQASSSRSPLANKTASPLRPLPSMRPQPTKNAALPADSGYYGSQSQDVMDVDHHVHATQSTQPFSPVREADTNEDVAFHVDEPSTHESPTVTKTMQSPTMTFQTAREEQTTRVLKDVTQKMASPVPNPSPVRSPAKQTSTYPVISPPSRFAHSSSPKKSSPLKTSPAKNFDEPMSDAPSENHSPNADEARSPSEGSSPIRPVVRKSSLNFASLPAREPLTHKKSLGARQSRPSHDSRQSYLGRHTGGKSLSNVDILSSTDDEDDYQDGMELDGIIAGTHKTTNDEVFADNHNKVYTQRLQDQISLLGKSQPNASRPSKSIPSSAVLQAAAAVASAPEVKEKTPEKSPAKTPSRSSPKKQAAPPTPGAFPDDDEEEEEWIAPPAVPEKDHIESSPRPALPKSYTADIMEGIHGMDSVSGAEFVLPKQRQAGSRSTSPQRGPVVPERTTSTLGHTKSASVSVLPELGMASGPAGVNSPLKAISVSNPALTSVSETGRPQTPKSPSRSFRDSPLKQVKNKLSSIIKSSRGLLASSAAISAEGKSLLSPSSTRLGFHADPSASSLATLATAADSLYPDLSQRATNDAPVVSSSGSPTRPVAKRTRSSTEREKEEKRKEKETQKEARLMNEQMDKLEKAREKEREKARVFSKEQERIAAFEKKVAAQKEQEVAQTPAPKQEKPTRTSPRKTKAQLEAAAKAAAEEDADMNDAPGSMAPPSVPRSAGPGQASRAREVRRPLKPTKETATKSRQAPTVIRVNTGSQHSQYHPSNSSLSSNLHDTLGTSQPQLKSKASSASLQQKPSLSSLRGSTAGRPKALELAAKRKEVEEKEAQRKRDAKAEIERKRAALQEEERRQEQQKRLEAEKQKAKEREQAASQAEAKKNAARQAAIERAKQTRAPPPAVRAQPTGPPDYNTGSDKAAASSQPPRPVSRMNTASQRPQEDLGRPVSAVLNQGAKAPPKRPLQQETNDGASRHPQARNGPSYQAKDAKRRRTSDDFFDELDMDSQPPNIKGPPVRPSGGLKKDMSNKSMFSAGYANVPPQSASRDLFKATGAIPFAPNPNPAGPSHKTPARPQGAAGAKSAAKSATRSSPRFQNGESIELPEIDTDDEDEEEDDANFGAAAWVDSPELRRALTRQETMDPSQIFGPPAPLVMEEVFSKSKDPGWRQSGMKLGVAELRSTQLGSGAEGRMTGSSQLCGINQSHLLFPAEFSAGSPHTPQQEDPFAKRRTQSASRTGRNSPLKRPPPRPAKEPLPTENEKTAEEVRFDAEGWSRKIGPQNFAHQPTQNKASSPTRPSSSNSRKPKSVHPTVGTAGLVNEESSSNEDTDGGARQPEAEPATTGSPMPMDIDPETPPPNPRSAPPSRRDSARNIPVEPSRPEWRPGNVQPVPEAPQPNGVKRAPFNPNTAGSEDSEDFRASFAELKNVAPFATKPSGLNSFGDLKSQLPFESRASERMPIEKEKKQDPELNFPPVPRAPTPPAALAVSGLKPSLTTWQKYLVEFQNYLQQWDAFNAQITYHFETRKAQILEERGTAGYAFLTTQGDEGVEEYLSWVRQDKEVRRKWSLACDEHEMRMLDFLKYKKLMR